jgi:enterochelin esterase-like enzyme
MKHNTTLINQILFFTTFLCVLSFRSATILAQTAKPYYDLTHPSAVFGHEKYYRIYLPDEYDKTQTNYPVIYFFHGWGGRHFKDDNALIEYENIKELVDKYKVILVMWDGNIDLNEPRAYNTGYHEDVKFQIQMKDYFPELVKFIDTHYRTLTDRNHRGIIGFSMGGFMSFFLAGKYPDQVCAAVSFAGSPEYFVGYPGNHTHYPVRYLFKNLEGVNARLYNGDSDILFYLNHEVYQGALWEGFPIDYVQFHGPHMIDKPGETKVFDSAMKFVTDSFKKENVLPENWTHYDLYSSFEVRGYKVNSDKNVPGMIELKNVNKNGFGLYTKRWMPDGPAIQNINITVTTPTLYKPNTKYEVLLYSVADDKEINKSVMSDSIGRLTFEIGSAGCEININDGTGKPEFVVANLNVDKNSRFLSTGKENKLEIKLFNKGSKCKTGDLRFFVSTNDSSVSVADSTLNITSDGRKIFLEINKIACSKTPPKHAEPAVVKFKVKVFSEEYSSEDELLVPVNFDVPFFDSIKIDDGTAIRDSSFGKGNGNSIVNPGECVLLYQSSNRLRLYTDDPWVIREDEMLTDEVIPARWPDGYTFSSIIHVSPECPDGHVVECLASYETKSFNPIERKVTWGKVKFTVTKK